MKVNDAKQKLQDAITLNKKNVCKLLDAFVEKHPNLISEKKKSIAYELAKRKDKIAACKNYKELRDLVVEALKEVESQPKAKELLAKIQFDYDKKVARDPRPNGYNEQYWFNMLLQHIWNIMMKAENLGSPDVKDSCDRLTIIHDSRKALVKLDDAKFDKSEPGYGDYAFKEFVSKMLAHPDKNKVLLYPISWLKDGKNSKLTFDVSVNSLFKQDDLVKMLESCLPEHGKLQFGWLKSRIKAENFEFAELPKKQLYQLVNELREKYGDIFDLEYDERSHKLTLEIDEDALEDKSLQDIRQKLVHTLYNDMSFTLVNGPDEDSNKIIFGLIDTETSFVDGKFDILLEGINEWNKEQANRTRIDTDAYSDDNGVKVNDAELDEIDRVVKLLGEAHDKINEALDLVESLENEDKVSSSIRYELEDREAELSDLDFEGEANPREAFLERFGPEEYDEYEEDFEEEEDY